MDCSHGRACQASLLLALGLMSLPFKAGAETYTLIDVGALLGTDSSASGINNLGAVAGLWSNGGPQRLFVYSHGTTVTLTAPDLTTFSVIAGGINDLGQVTGFGCCIGGSASSFIFDSRTQSVAAVPVGPQSLATAINDRGEVTGDGAEGLLGPFAFLYHSRQGTFSDLGSLAVNAPDPVSSGIGINEAGAVTGSAELDSGAQHAFISSDGAMSDLGTLGGENSEGHGINRAGRVTGLSQTATGSMHAFRYGHGKMRDLGTLGGDFSEGNAINASGEIVGESTESGDVIVHAFIYRDRKMFDLNKLIDRRSPLAPFVTLSGGVGINERGEIAANGSDSRTGKSHAYLLIPQNGEQDKDQGHERGRHGD